MVVVVRNELRVGQSQSVGQHRHVGIKIGVAFDKNRTILQDSDIPCDEVQGWERFVSPASQVNRLSPHRDAKAAEHLTAVGMPVSRY